MIFPKAANAYISDLFLAEIFSIRPAANKILQTLFNL